MMFIIMEIIFFLLRWSGIISGIGAMDVRNAERRRFFVIENGQRTEEHFAFKIFFQIATTAINIGFNGYVFKLNSSKHDIP